VDLNNNKVLNVIVTGRY